MRCCVSSHSRNGGAPLASRAEKSRQGSRDAARALKKSARASRDVARAPKKSARASRDDARAPKKPRTSFPTDARASIRSDRGSRIGPRAVSGSDQPRCDVARASARFWTPRRDHLHALLGKLHRRRAADPRARARDQRALSSARSWHNDLLAWVFGSRRGDSTLARSRGSTTDKPREDRP